MDCCPKNNHSLLIEHSPVSQIFALTLFPSTIMLLVAKSTPMVFFDFILNAFLVNRERRFDFPTPLSPISTTVEEIWKRTYQLSNFTDRCIRLTGFMDYECTMQIPDIYKLSFSYIPYLPHFQYTKVTHRRD